MFFTTSCINLKLCDNKTINRTKGRKMKMNKYLSVVVCIFFIGVLLLPGILRKAWGQEKEGNTLIEEKSKTKETFAEEKTEYKNKVKKQLDVLDKKIRELETRVKKSGSKIEADVKKDMKELERKRLALKKEMKKLDAESREEWEDAKQKVDSAIDELQENYNKIRDKFKSE